MNNLSLMTEAGALGGYTINSGTGQDALNKARAQRRVNIVKADIISRYGGKWDSSYREGWLPLAGIESNGTVAFTNGSNTVVGTSTQFTTAMKGYKIQGSDGAFYKIASVQSATSLVMTQPFQGATSAGSNTFIWKDEYKVYCEALTIGGFLDYQLNESMREAWPKNMKDSFPNPAYTAIPDIYTIVGRNPNTVSYSIGTVTVAINTNTWTGSGTSWLANLEPGMSFQVGPNTYHIKRINSDTEIETYQLAVVAVTNATYTAIGKNSLLVRFKLPTTQRIVNYWYWAKDYPFVNDNDEDWIAENYPKVILNGIMYYDYIDKNDPVRADRASIAYETSIKDMKVAMDAAFTGPRTLGLYIPDNARD